MRRFLDRLKAAWRDITLASHLTLGVQPQSDGSLSYWLKHQWACFGRPKVTADRGPGFYAPRSRRCEKCHTCWPKDYYSCPECDRPTWPHRAAPILDHEALRRTSHARFEKWLDENDRRWLPEEKIALARMAEVKDASSIATIIDPDAGRGRE